MMAKTDTKKVILLCPLRTVRSMLLAASTENIIYYFNIERLRRHLVAY